MANQEQPLSAYNVFHELQQEICDVLNKSQILTANNVLFIPENRCDIDYQIKNSLKKQGLACVCLTPNARYLGHNGTNSAYQLDDLTLQIVEYTPINRAKNQQSVITGLDLANYCAEILAGPNSVIGFGNINTKSIEQGEDNGLLVTKAIFQTALTNGQQPIIYIPFVTRDEMEQYVGDGKLTFTKDGQEIGLFTANLKTDISVELPNDGIWGKITGNIEEQADLIEKLNDKASQEQVDEIEAKIPSAATSENLLADKAFVNSSINNYAAFYLTKNANGDAFGTYGEMLLAGTYWNAGVLRIPTKNDYLIVLEDETKTTALGVRPTTRYIYQGEWPTGLFEFQYIVNNTALTQAQVDAINSGITKSLVDSMVVSSTTHPGYAANADNAATASTALSANYALDVKPFDASKITSGTIESARLPLATSSAQGSVKPVAKTSAMTQDVGVDSSGRLYTAPATGGVTKIVAGSNVTISPASGTGEVTINASGGGGGGSGDYVPLSTDIAGNKTAATIGTRNNGVLFPTRPQPLQLSAIGANTFTVGTDCAALSANSFAQGLSCVASGKNSIALGNYAITDKDNTFVWSGYPYGSLPIGSLYEGTFCINNPAKNPEDIIYVNYKRLVDLITEGDNIYCKQGSTSDDPPGWNFTSINNGQTYIDYSQINNITNSSSKPYKIVGYFEISEADSQDYEIVVGTTGYDNNDNVSFVWKGNAGNNGNIKVPFIIVYNPMSYSNYIQVNGGYSTIYMYITAIYKGGIMKGSFQ